MVTSDRWLISLYSQNKYVEDIDQELCNPTDKRIFAIATAFHLGYSVEKIWQMTNIDKWFLKKLQNIHETEKFLMCAEYILSLVPFLIPCFRIA